MFSLTRKMKHYLLYKDTKQFSVLLCDKSPKFYACLNNPFSLEAFICGLWVITITQTVLTVMNFSLRSKLASWVISTRDKASGASVASCSQWLFLSLLILYARYLEIHSVHCSTLMNIHFWCLFLTFFAPQQYFYTILLNIVH